MMFVNYILQNLNKLSFGDVIARFLLFDESLANVIKIINYKLK
jgi:hypothetical protein